MRELTDHEQNLLSTDQWRPLAFLRGEMLEVTHAELRRWEAHALAVEDQRDKGFAERDTLIAAAMDTVHKGIAAYNTAIAERDEARKALSDFRSSLVWEDK